MFVIVVALSVIIQEVLKAAAGIPKSKLHDIVSCELKNEFERRTQLPANAKVLEEATAELVDKLWANRTTWLTKQRTAAWRKKHKSEDASTPLPKSKPEPSESTPGMKSEPAVRNQKPREQSLKPEPDESKSAKPQLEPDKLKKDAEDVNITNQISTSLSDLCFVCVHPVPESTRLPGQTHDHHPC